MSEYSYTYEEDEDVEVVDNIVPVPEVVEVEVFDTKKTRGKKSIQKPSPKAPKSEQESETSSHTEPISEPKPIVTKKPRSVAQINALEKARKARQVKAQERKQLKNDIENMKLMKLEKDIEKKVDKKLKKQAQELALKKQKQKLARKIMSTESSESYQYVPLKKTKARRELAREPQYEEPPQVHQSAGLTREQFLMAQMMG